MHKKEGKEMRFIELHQDGTVIAINRDSIRCVATGKFKSGVESTELILNRPEEENKLFPFYVDDTYKDVLALLNQD